MNASRLLVQPNAFFLLRIVRGKWGPAVEVPETSQDQYICPSDKAETHCVFDGF